MKSIIIILKGWAKKNPDNPWALVFAMFIIMIIVSIVIALFTQK